MSDECARLRNTLKNFVTIGATFLLLSCRQGDVGLLTESAPGQELTSLEDSDVQPTDLSPADGKSLADTEPTKVASESIDLGHARMVKLLQDFAVQTQQHHPILGGGDARALRLKLADAGSSGRVPSGLLWQLGLVELRLGNLEQAIAHLTTVHSRMQQLSKTQDLPPPWDLQPAYQLGIAYMRRGETENCCQRNSLDSCLLPIQDSGLHLHQDGSRQAITYFEDVLERAATDAPLYLKAKWLLNIMYMTIGGYPDNVPADYLIPPSKFESEEPFPKFVNRASKLGVDTYSLLGGAIVDDFTGDDYVDIVASTWDPSEPTHFFQNNQDGTFSDRTEEANLHGIVGGFNMIHADYDNDGDLDILMLRGAWMRDIGKIPNSLLRNDGRGRFTDVTVDSGLGDVHYPTATAAWADYDNDGDLDLYIGNELLDGEVHAPCQLFLNQGDGKFRDVAEEAGVLNFGFAKGVVWGDYNDDRFPDLYVSNLGQDNRLFRNNCDGTFTDVAELVGTLGPKMSFPTWFWDFDNDGVLDLYVSSYEYDRGNLAAVVASKLGLPVEFESARLYRGNGEGGFEEVSAAKNLTQLNLPMGANFGDLDNDGFLDFYLGTGYPDYEALMPNVMFRNRRGERFVDVTSAGGFGHLQKGHGVVFADIDNDGDQDVFEQLGGFYPGDKFFDALFENPGFGNHWITIKLIGVRSNRAAIGARIVVSVRENGKPRTIYKHVNSGGTFGANPLRQTIGLGASSRIESLRVFWPTTGETQNFADVAMDQSIKITEGQGIYTVLPLKRLRLSRASTSLPFDQESSD